MSCYYLGTRSINSSHGQQWSSTFSRDKLAESVCKPPGQAVILEGKNPPFEQMGHSGFPLMVDEVTGCFFCRELLSRGFQI